MRYVIRRAIGRRLAKKLTYLDQYGEFVAWDKMTWHAFRSFDEAKARLASLPPQVRRACSVEPIGEI